MDLRKEMKLLLSFVLVFCFVFPAAQASDSQSAETNDLGAKIQAYEMYYLQNKMLDGNDLASIPDPVKASYLFGYEDGVVNMVKQFGMGPEEKKEVLSTLPSSVKDISMDSLISYVDDFYTDEKNLNIPVPYVLLITRNRIAHMSEEEIGKYVIFLRKNFGESKREKVVPQTEEKSEPETKTQMPQETQTEANSPHA